MIEADALRRDFGGRPAVRDVSFRVDPGEIVGFLGPNGAGKTTTMRMLLGLLRPSSGRGTIEGSVGYLPEGHVGYEHLSVERYLRFLARAKGLRGTDAATTIGAALAAVDLDDLRRRPLGRLSRGQRQRAGIAQALLGSPDAYVFDEPTAGLDPTQVVDVRTTFRRLADDGAAVLVSTHLLAEARAVCDRVVIVARGRVLADEAPTDDLEQRFLQLVARAELSDDEYEAAP